MKKFVTSGVFEGLSFSQESNKPFIIKGKFSEADVENGNGRIYCESLLSREVESLQEQIKNRQLLGELSHPDNRLEIDPAEAAILITKLEMHGKEVYGEAEVLDTPKGKIVKCLYDANVKLGISSRGYIPEESDYVYEGGNCYLPEDYQMITFDVVLEPSCFGAFPVKESVKKQITKLISESKKISKDLKSSINSLFSSNSQPITINLPSLKATLIAKDYIEESFNIRTKRIGKQLKLYVTENNFGFNLMTNKIKAYLDTASDFNGYQLIIPEGLLSQSSKIISKEVNTVSTAIPNEQLEALQTQVSEANEKLASQEKIISSLESKKVLLMELVESYRSDLNKSQDNAKGLLAFKKLRTKRLTDSNNLLNKRLKTLKESKHSQFRKMVFHLKNVIKASLDKTTCSERVIVALKNKYNQSQKISEKGIHDLLLANTKILEENASLRKQLQDSISVIEFLKAQFEAQQPVSRIKSKNSNAWQPNNSELFSKSPSQTSVAEDLNKISRIKNKLNESYDREETLILSTMDALFNR